MEISVKINVEFNKDQLCNAISNVLFAEFTSGNKKKISEMNLMDLASYIPEIIANEIIKDTKDIIKTS